MRRSRLAVLPLASCRRVSFSFSPPSVRVTSSMTFYWQPSAEPTATGLLSGLRVKTPTTSLGLGRSAALTGAVAQLLSVGALQRAMSLSRKILGTIAVVGILVWGFIMCVAALMASRFTASEVFYGFFPVVVFIFYAVIAIRPCRAVTALVVGAMLHVPLLFVMAAWYRDAHESLVFAAALVFGAVVWAIYVIQLRRHENAA